MAKLVSPAKKARWCRSSSEDRLVSTRSDPSVALFSHILLSGEALHLYSHTHDIPVHTGRIQSLPGVRGPTKSKALGCLKCRSRRDNLDINFSCCLRKHSHIHRLLCSMQSCRIVTNIDKGHPVQHSMHSGTSHAAPSHCNLDMSEKSFARVRRNLLTDWRLFK